MLLLIGINPARDVFHTPQAPVIGLLLWVALLVALALQLVTLGGF